MKTEKTEQKRFTKVQRKNTKDRNVFNHHINSQAAKIDNLLLNSQLTVVQIAARVKTIKSRVKTHIYHLKAAHAVTIVKESANNKTVYFIKTTESE